MGLLRSLAVVVVLLSQARASAEVIVFGDSLSDTGNFAILSGGTVPPTPLYASGRFSNGPVWVERLSLILNEPVPEPSLQNGTNYAFNGARAFGDSPFDVPDVMTQVSTYLAAEDYAVDPRDIFVLWAGANDIFFGAVAGEVDFIPNAVAAIESSVAQLRKAGARRILVLNLPPLGQTPFFNRDPILSAQFDFASYQFNDSLSEELQRHLSGRRRDTVAIVNIEGLFEVMRRKPRWFRLANVSDSCTLFDPVGSGLGTELIPGVDPDRYLFWDSIHPTARGHAIVANAAYLTLWVPALRPH